MRGVQKRVGGDRGKAVTVLRETCRAQLKRFDTTIEEDNTILKCLGTEDHRLQIAVTYRREKKVLLKHIIENWDGTLVRVK